MKCRDGKSQRTVKEEKRKEKRIDKKKRQEEEKKTEDQRKDKVKGEKMQMRQRAHMPRFTVFCSWFMAREGRQVRSLKRRVLNHLTRGEVESYSPLWREAHVQAKSVKNGRSQAILLEVEMSKKCLRPFPWKLRCRKSAHCCGAKHVSKSKCSKRNMLRLLVEVDIDVY